MQRYCVSSRFTVLRLRQFAFRPSVSLSVGTFMNKIIRKQMNWFCCKLAQSPQGRGWNGQLFEGQNDVTWRHRSLKWRHHSRRLRSSIGFLLRVDWQTRDIDIAFLSVCHVCRPVASLLIKEEWVGFLRCWTFFMVWKLKFTVAVYRRKLDFYKNNNDWWR